MLPFRRTLPLKMPTRKMTPGATAVTSTRPPLRRMLQLNMQKKSLQTLRMSRTTTTWCQLICWTCSTDPITCQGTLNGDILGRIKEMRSGEASAAVSVYCRKHGCTAPLTRTHKAPAVDDILAWFEAGQELPPGADSRPQHVAMYRELLRRKGISQGSARHGFVLCLPWRGMP